MQISKRGGNKMPNKYLKQRARGFPEQQLLLVSCRRKTGGNNYEE